MPVTKSNLFRESPEVDERSLSFFLSAFMFRVALALVTFEQVRPFGVMLADYCFFLSLLFILPSAKVRLLKSAGSGVLLTGALILSGALLSLQSGSGLGDAMGPLTKLFILYGLFAPLALIHAKNIRKNMLFLVCGISLNCAVALLQSWAFPGILDALSINPASSIDYGNEGGRFQGLTSHPNILGLAAALALLIGVGLFLLEKGKHARWALALLVLICTDAALLSGSRTFLAAVIPGLLVFALMQKQRRRAVMRVLIAVVVLWAALTYFFPSAVSQFSDRVSDVGLVDYGRVVVAAQAVDEISQKPLLGWGVAHFGEAGLSLLPGIAELQPAHVTLLQYWYGAGLLGAIGFLALFAIPLRRIFQALKQDPADDQISALRLGVGCCVLLFISSNLNPILFNRFLYIPLFIFAGFATCVLGPVEVHLVPRWRPLSAKTARNLQPLS